jgi:two-component system, chemotaxis family, sensor kinase CheA
VQLSRYTELFRSESREQIETVNHLLLALEADPAAHPPVDGIFRAVHTLKGMASTMGYSVVAEVAHEMESVLDRLRRERVPAPPQLIETLFRAADALEEGIESAAEGSDVCAAAVLAELRTLTVARVHSAAAAAAAPAAEREAAASSAPIAIAAPAAGPYRVRACIAADSALPGARAFMLLRAARQLGEVTGSVPPEAELQGGSFENRIEFVLVSAEPADSIHRRLVAVGEIAEISIESTIAAPAGPTEREVPRPPSRHVRVDAGRLDTLLDRVGELVILRDRLIRTAATERSAAFADPVEQIARLVGELRDEVFGLRMVAVREVFGRLPRVVRDAAHTLGKEVDLAIEGDDTELDRAVLERIGDPLVHLLRNAVDHGIETAAERRALGKPAAGRLHLSARREPNRLLIRLADDGRGIDLRRVARRAVELGLAAGPESEIDDDEALDLITRPGLSTADRVTGVSGRGVGLDVVATQMRALGGTLDIATRAGEGTVFSMRLPLTVGLMRVLLVSAGGSPYAIPVAHVAETVELPARDVSEVGGRRLVLLRDEVLPLNRLDLLLGTADAAGPRTERITAIVLEIEDQRIALEVAALHGQQEVVTKSFDAPHGTLPLFAGATILTDGTPALMLDAASLIRRCRTSVSTRVRLDEP